MPACQRRWPPCAAPNALAAAVQLSQNEGEIARKLGETGSVKLDEYSRRIQYLSLRVSTARSYGTNNVTFDRESITNDALSANGEENVETETASLSLSERHYAAADEPSTAQFSQDGNSCSEYDRNTSDIYDWMEDFGQSSTFRGDAGARCIWRRP